MMLLMYKSRRHGGDSERNKMDTTWSGNVFFFCAILSLKKKGMIMKNEHEWFKNKENFSDLSESLMKKLKMQQDVPCTMHGVHNILPVLCTEQWMI